MPHANKKKHQRKEYAAFEEIKRLLNGYDIKSVADAAGIAVATLYHWLSGHVRTPHLRTLVAVAEVLGYDIALKRVGAPAKLRRNLRLV